MSVWLSAQGRNTSTVVIFSSLILTQNFTVLRLSLDAEWLTSIITVAKMMSATGNTRFLHTPDRHGYSVKFSPFNPSLLGVATGQNFGLSGEGKSSKCFVPSNIQVKGILTDLYGELRKFKGYVNYGIIFKMLLKKNSCLDSDSWMPCRRWQSGAAWPWTPRHWLGALLWVAGRPLWLGLEWAGPPLCCQCCRGWLPSDVEHIPPTGERITLLHTLAVMKVLCQPAATELWLTDRWEQAQGMYELQASVW